MRVSAGIRPFQPHLHACQRNLLRFPCAAAPAEQESPAAQSASAASPAPAASPPPLPQEFSEQQLNCVLKTLDESVGQVIEALPVNAMLVLYTCQGDTVQFRMMQVGMPLHEFSTMLYTCSTKSHCTEQPPCSSGMLQCFVVSMMNHPTQLGVSCACLILVYYPAAVQTIIATVMCRSRR